MPPRMDAGKALQLQILSFNLQTFCHPQLLFGAPHPRVQWVRNRNQSATSGLLEIIKSM